MKYGQNILQAAALDLVSLGALNYRVDSGVIPFRKATACPGRLLKPRQRGGSPA